MKRQHGHGVATVTSRTTRKKAGQVAARCMNIGCSKVCTSAAGLTNHEKVCPWPPARKELSRELDYFEVPQEALTSEPTEDPGDDEEPFEEEDDVVYSQPISLASLSDKGDVAEESECRGASELYTTNRAVYNRQDPFWPFQNEAEFWFACETQDPPRWSSRRVTRHLQAIHDQQLGYSLETEMTNSQQLYRKLDQLVSSLGDRWWRGTIDLKGGSWAGTYDVHYIEAKDAACALFGRPDLANHIVYRGHEDTSPDGSRLWNEMYTADRWLEVQRDIADDECVLAIIAGSDETQLATLSGDQKAWPVYLSLGNIPLKVRRSIKNECFVLIGYLPTIQAADADRGSPSFLRAKRQLYQASMKMIFESLIADSQQYVPIAVGVTVRQK